MAWHPGTNTGRNHEILELHERERATNAGTANTEQSASNTGTEPAVGSNRGVMGAWTILSNRNYANHPKADKIVRAPLGSPSHFAVAASSELLMTLQGWTCQISEVYS